MNRNLLSEEHQKLFKTIFEKLDVHGDLIVPRSDFLYALRKDVRVAAILNQPAVFIASIEDTVNIDKIFNEIDQDANIGSREEREAKEYISWGQFMQYFNNYKGSEDLTNNKLMQDEYKTSRLNKT